MSEVVFGCVDVGLSQFRREDHHHTDAFRRRGELNHAVLGVSNKYRRNIAGSMAIRGRHLEFYQFSS